MKPHAIRAFRLSIATSAFLLMFALLGASPGAQPLGKAGIATASPTCDPALTGTPAAETITGTPGDDHICGMGGADLLVGLGGNDIIEGGTGNDIVRAGKGDDVLRGGRGNDRLNGNPDADALYGGPGNDQLRGGNHADHLSGGTGDDFLTGRFGDDVLFGSDGTTGNDRIDGRAGTDGCTSDTGDTAIDCETSATNAAPDAVDDAASVLINSGATNLTVLANDTDADGDDFEVTAVSDPANGTSAIVPGFPDRVSYQPDAGYCNTQTGATPKDTFTYSITDGNNGFDTATVTMTVVCNQPPNAVDDTATVAEDSIGTQFAVLSNDSDPDLDTLEITGVSDPAHGSASVVQGAPDKISYTPDADFCSPPADTFTYTVDDGRGGSDTATVTVTVTCVQDTPDAVDDSTTVVEDATATSINVLGNDSDVDGDSLDITAATDPANGTTAISGVFPAEKVDYTPDPNYCNAPPPGSTDTFTYTVNDGHANTDTATVSVTVTCVNDAPVATDDSLSPVAEDSSQRTITKASLLSNDSKGPANESAQTLDITTVSNPVGGTVLLSGANVLFTPAADFNGAASFDYVVTDDGTTNGAADPRTDTGSVSFTITEVNDAPVATDDSLSAIDEDSGQRSISKASLTSNDSKGPANESGQTLDITAVTNPVGGTVSLSGANVLFDPTPNYNGPASFDYTLTDNGTTNLLPDPKTDTGSVSFTINAVNDPPAITAPATVSADLYTDKVISGVSVADPDASPDAITMTFAGANGSLTLPTTVPGGLVAGDITGNGTHSVSVTATQAKINTTLGDPAGLTYHSDPLPFAGTSDTVNLGTNDLGHNGSGGAQTDAKSITIQFNQPPTATPQTVSTNEDTAKTITLAGTDPDLDPLTFKISSLPAAGELHDGATVGGTLITTVPFTLTGNQVTYLPPANQSGVALESFQFKVNDGFADSAPATVTIDVTAVNDAPVLANVEGTALAYTENDPATQITGAITVSDVDDTSLASGTVSITTGFSSAQDTLTYTAPGGNPITGSYGPGTGIMTLTGPGTLAQFEAALRAVKYQNSSDNPTTARTISFQVDDGHPANHASNVPTRGIAITPVNDAPVLAGVEAAALAYTENDPATLISPAITAADIDSNIATGTVSITTNFASGQDVLSYTQPGGNPVTGSYNSGTGVFTLSGPGTPAEFQAALRAVRYANSSDAPSTATRTVTFNVDDGQAVNHASNSPTRNITVTAANDAPVLANVEGPALGYTENDPATQITNAITVADVDNASLASGTVSITAGFASAQDTLAYAQPGGNPITGGYNSGTGVLTLTGPGTLAQWQAALRAVTYQNSSNSPTANRTISFQVDDGQATNHASNVPTRGITITAVNDAPVNTAPATASVNEDTPLNFTAGNAVSVADVDAGAGAMQIQLSVTNGTLTMTTLTGLSFSVGDGTGDPAMTFTGTLTAVNNALATLRFDPTPNFPGAAASGTAAFSITSNDQGSTGSGGALSDTDGTTITVNQVNDPPVGGGDSAQTVGNVELFYDLAPGGAVGTTKTTPSTNGVLDNDSDPIEGSAVSVAGVVACADVSSPFDCATANGGSITLNANGRFTFRPAAGSTAADSFQYVLTDSGTPIAQTVNVTTNLTFVGNRIWFVRNNATAGGVGRSNDPFDTLAEAQTAANAANDRVFVYFGDGTTTGQAAGFTMAAAGQTLQGQGVALTTGTTVNGIANATLVAAGSQPLIADTTANGVDMSVGSTVTGLSIAGTVNAIDLTTAGAVSGTNTISGNTIRGAGAEGIDVNLNAGTAGTLALGITNNSWNTAGTHTGNAIDVNRAAGTLNLNVTGNTNVLSTGGSGIVIAGGAVANTTVTGFAGNSVHGNTAGAGISISNVTFDANVVTAGIQQVDGDTLAIGASGNPVGGGGLAINTSQGNLFFDDLDIFSATATALGATGTGTGLTFSVQPNTTGGSSTIDEDSGRAVDITSATIDLRLADLDSDGATSGVNFSTVGGQFSAPSGSSITKASGAGTAFTVASSVSGSSFAYGGTMNVTSGAGVSLTTNTGSTISFTGTLTLSTGGNAAFTATGGGTVTATGSGSTLATSNATALNVSSTTIGATGLTFRSISAGTPGTGPASGIILNTTGSLGGLTVAGDGLGANNGSGGTIQNSTGPGVNLSSTGPVSLSYMNVQSGGDDGIRGSAVSGFSLARSNVTTNGNAVGERGIDLLQLSGSGGISNSTISGSAETNVRIENDTANLTSFNVTAATIATTNFTTGDDGFLVLDTGNASMTVSVTGSTFTDNKGDHFQAATDADATGPMNITFNNNSLTTTAANDPNVIGGGITINTSGSTDITFQVNNNNLQQAFDDGININLDPGSLAGASMNGTISGNTIGTAGQDDSASESSNAITVASKGAGNTTFNVTNNTINEWGNGFGIFVGTTEGTSDVNAAVTGNTVKNGGTFAINAIRIDAGATAANGGDNGLLEVTLTGNNVTASMPGVVGAGEDIRLRQRFNTTIKLPGYGGANSDNTAVINFVAANNDPVGATPAPTVSAINNVGGGGGGFIGGPDL